MSTTFEKVVDAAELLSYFRHFWLLRVTQGPLLWGHSVFSLPEAILVCDSVYSLWKRLCRGIGWFLKRGKSLKAWPSVSGAVGRCSAELQVLSAPSAYHWGCCRQVLWSCNETNNSNANNFAPDVAFSKHQGCFDCIPISRPSDADINCLRDCQSWSQSVTFDFSQLIQP